MNSCWYLPSQQVGGTVWTNWGANLLNSKNYTLVTRCAKTLWNPGNRLRVCSLRDGKTEVASRCLEKYSLSTDVKPGTGASIWISVLWLSCILWIYQILWVFVRFIWGWNFDMLIGELYQLIGYDIWDCLEEINMLGECVLQSKHYKRNHVEECTNICYWPEEMGIRVNIEYNKLKEFIFICNGTYYNWSQLKELKLEIWFEKENFRHVCTSDFKVYLWYGVEARSRLCAKIVFSKHGKGYFTIKANTESDILLWFYLKSKYRLQDLTIHR